MCEYSLEAAKTVPAKQGETYKFGHMPDTMHGCFVTDEKCDTAACMPGGTRLRVTGISKGMQSHFGIPAEADVEMVRKPVENAFYDVMKFENGKLVRLGYLGADCIGGRWLNYDGASATVLMLGAVNAPEDHVLAGPPAPVRAPIRPVYPGGITYNNALSNAEVAVAYRDLGLLRRMLRV